MQVGDKVKLKPREQDMERWPYVRKYDGFIATIRSVGVIPTIWIKAKTSYGRWWIGWEYGEMEVVNPETPLSVMG